MTGVIRTDPTQMLLAYLPPTPRQTLSAVSVMMVLVLGLIAVAPFAARSLTASPRPWMRSFW